MQFLRIKAKFAEIENSLGKNEKNPLSEDGGLKIYFG
jgi:hypothetical protein